MLLLHLHRRHLGLSLMHRFRRLVFLDRRLLKLWQFLKDELVDLNNQVKFLFDDINRVREFRDLSFDLLYILLYSLLLLLYLIVTRFVTQRTLKLLSFFRRLFHYLQLLMLRCRKKIGLIWH